MMPSVMAFVLLELVTVLIAIPSYDYSHILGIIIFVVGTGLTEWVSRNILNHLYNL